jgi:hypothetical protein
MTAVAFFPIIRNESTRFSSGSGLFDAGQRNEMVSYLHYHGRQYMQKYHPRVIREKITMEKMIALYCQHEHHLESGQICSECRELTRYALERLERCPFQQNKSICAKCTIHCYKPQMRLKIRHLMALVGPRMLLHYPVLTIRHFIDGLRPAPALPKD